MMMDIFSITHQGQRLVWDTAKLTEHLEEQRLINNRKGADRWLNKQGWLLDIVNHSDLCDEDNSPLKRQVAKDLIATAKKRRYSILTLQSFSISGRYGLLAHDGKGSRRWLWNDKPWSNQSLQDALCALVNYNDKNTLFFPHGQITALFRALWSQSQQRPWQCNQHKAMLAMAAYPTKLDLSQQTINEKIHIATGQSHLDRLEAESIHIMREVMAQADNPVMLYSVGKDSAVMLHLARKAFYPSPPPFPLLHVDTGWKFQEMYQFRDLMAQEAGMKLIVHTNPEGAARNISPLVHGSALHTDIMKTQGLKQALNEHKFDIAFGGARRDEEKSRAKERVFSFRNEAHRWEPKNQRPELWNLYNGRKQPNESIRVFPLSNWTELDIWQYIYRENIPIVPLYFAQVRPVIERDSMLMMVDDNRLNLLEGEKIEYKRIRFRTLGCYPLTGAFESTADNLESVILELLQSRISERQGRAIDSDSNASMEQKKQEGYF